MKKLHLRAVNGLRATYAAATVMWLGSDYGPFCSGVCILKFPCLEEEEEEEEVGKEKLPRQREREEICIEEKDT